MSIKILSLFLSVILLTSCVKTETDVSKIVAKDDRSSKIIMFLDDLSFSQDLSSIDDSLHLFLKGFNLLKIGKIERSEKIFNKLRTSSSHEAIEYGEYGILLLSYETDNMSNMQQQLDIIKGMNNKSDWLSNEWLKYYIYLSYNTAEFNIAKSALNSISDLKLSNKPLLSSIKAELLIRENDLEEAMVILDQLKVESEFSISVKARLISLTEGDIEATQYLHSKVQEYPSNEGLKLLYNQYLVRHNKNEALNNAYELGLKTQNIYILAHAIKILFLDTDNPKGLSRLNTLNSKLNNSNFAENYIDYYLVKIALPLNENELMNSIDIANEFNPKNYNLLMLKYYMANDRESQFKVLKDIENLDPYDNYILIELAKFYKINSKQEKLLEIKKRFELSKRIKTDAELEFFNSLLI